MGDLVPVEELAQELVRPEQVALLREPQQLEAALHLVPVQELMQGRTLTQELSLVLFFQLLSERLVDYLEADLWTKRKVTDALYPR